MPEIPFDPDATDVNDDPEYINRMAHPGPGTNLSWAPAGEATLAKQLAMLEIDSEMMTAWLVSMEKLIEKRLPDVEFTAERMTRLKFWQKERKRRQFNLHYQYDPRRRRPEKVEKDVKAQLTKSLARMEALSEQLNIRMVHVGVGRRPVEAQGSIEARPVRQRAQTPPTPRVPAATAGRVPDPDPGREWLIATVAEGTGIPDPVNAPENEIREAYRRNGEDDAAAIDSVLDLLHGRTLPGE